MYALVRELVRVSHSIHQLLSECCMVLVVDYAKSFGFDNCVLRSHARVLSVLDILEIHQGHDLRVFIYIYIYIKLF